MASGKKYTICTVCNSRLDLGSNPEVGLVVVCEECDTEFEIVDLDPITLDYAEFGEDDELEDDLFEEDDDYFDDDLEDDYDFDDDDDDDDF